MANDGFSTTRAAADSELTTNISATVGTLLTAGSVRDTLGRVVELAVTTIEGCDFAGIFVLDEGTVATPVYTDQVVTDLDDLQRQAGEGPCLDALNQGVTFYADDLGHDDRWPRFGIEAATRDIRSLLALPFPLNDAPGALNLYARHPDAFSVIDRGRGALLAAIAGLALTVAQTHEEEERRADNLHAALATREIIGQAQGILMERERLSPDQAFDVLRRASQHLNLKLRDVAQSLVDTGERPDTGRPC